MSKLLATTLFCFALGVTVSAAAEDLLQIYDLAVNSDPVVRESEQILYATRELKPQRRAALLPNLALSGSAAYRSDHLTGTSGGRSYTRSDTYSQIGTGAQLNQTLYNRAHWIRLSQAERQISQAEAQYQAAQIDLMVRVAQAYFDVLKAADRVRVSQALVAAYERQLEQSKQRFQVGLVAIVAVNDSQAAYDRARANLIGAENGLGNAWEALRRIIGPVTLPLARLGDKLPLAPPEPNDINVWAETALANNFTIIAAREAAEAARREIDAQRAAHYPTLGMQAGYDLSRTDAELGNDRDSAYIGLNLTIPLYQGGAVTSRTREAGHSFRAAQDRLDQQRRAVIQQVKDAFRGILSSISDIQARQAAVVSARSALESTQAGFEVGTSTQVDVLNAQSNLSQAEFDYLSSRYEYILNGLRLHRATSTLTREVLAKANAWLAPQDTVAPPPL